MTASDVLAEHYYLNLGRKCSCNAVTRTPMEWAEHAEQQLHFANALDVLELGNVPVHKAIDLLENADTAMGDATESDNPHALTFAAGFMAGTVQRVILMLKGQGQ